MTAPTSRGVRLVLRGFVVAALAGCALTSGVVRADLRSVECRKNGTVVDKRKLAKGQTYVCTARGSWLDITSDVTGPSGLALAIMDKGAGAPGSEPFIRVRIEVGSNASAGDKRI